MSMELQPNSERGSFEDSAIVDGETVRERELDEILRRRQYASQHGMIGEDPDREDVRKSLVGLSLSGGGLRSGAFSLGVMQALYKRGVLPFIDYLSTVSGGGYAGAYFSSVSLLKRQGSVRSESSGDESSDSANSATRATNDAFPISPFPSGQQPPRMRKFIFSGSYLKKTWKFFNRHLVGLLLIWAVAFSALIAITSLTAWMFRCLDYPTSRAWLGALGFSGDTKLAFFPSFVLLWAWLVAWAISYFKYGHRSS